MIKRSKVKGKSRDSSSLILWGEIFKGYFVFIKTRDAEKKR